MRFYTSKREVRFSLDTDTFYVYEIDRDGVVVDSLYQSRRTGEHFVYVLIKRNWATDVAISRIAEMNNLRYRDIGFAGMKDKRATTYQLISSKSKLTSTPKDIELIPVGSGERLRMGDLSGNMFRVIAGQDLESIRKGIDDTGGRFLNYFGSQRFGKGGVNVLVGLELLRGRLSDALDIYLYYKRENSDLRETGQFPRYLKHERMILDMRKKYDDRRVWARIPRNISLMFIHSVQSYIFNMELDMRFDNSDIIDTTNLVGWSTELNPYQREILDMLNIQKEMFRMEILPSLNAKGGTRKILAHAERIRYDHSSIEFSLDSGSYATVFLDQMVGYSYLNQSEDIKFNG
ncbi:MAG: tRNA pseudouridine(13) synthase TruD [Candidatus Micrarchaeota archaeon]|nr:tRNA pseudouridine(13) synthase TruD [Candidatus Micrarchaeota archaeon]MCX8154498.1 tRNA pseudouridine(13) synthase TruD [Candidatus Micrarchaeota archaeon]